MRRTGLLAILAAFVLYAGTRTFHRLGVDVDLLGAPLDPGVLTGVALVAVLLVIFGAYTIIAAAVREHMESRRRRHDLLNALRLGFGVLGLVGVFGVLTREWLSVLFSLGILGFAVTFALQQPLFSLIGWIYIVINRPYQVGDRIAIEDIRGDVVSIDFFVTEVWEIDGDLVSSNQPSWRIVTVPNSTILSSRVVNFHGEGVPYVWNELSVQVAYETDLGLAADLMVEVADDHLGDEMARQIAEYRDRLAETPVELDVHDRPTVNIVQEESWVTLRLRYLVHPRQGTRARNALYEGILERLNAHPEAVKFPVGRNR